jgi:hypothetical protein
MAAAEPRLDPQFDPEQAGIILDRLAGELRRAMVCNPDGVASVVEDSWQVLACTEAWLERERSDLARLAARVALASDPDALAGGLRQLAERLLELVDERERSARKLAE